MGNKSNYLGEFEHVVLLSILCLRDDAYGLTIRQHLKKSVGREVSIGAVYSTTERLEKKGYLVSSKSGATKERGGKAKRFYQVTSLGKQALADTRNQLETLWMQLPFNLNVGGA